MAMRILVASDQWFPDFHGGSARVATETAQRLAELGHEVVALAPRVEGQPERAVSGALTVLRVLPRTVVPQTVTDVLATARQSRAVQGSFDVLVGHQGTTATGLGRSRRGTPLVRIFHASAAREARFLRTRLSPGRQKLSAFALGRLLSTLERRSVDGASRIIVLSEYSRSLLLEDHPDVAARVRLAGGGVDTGVFAPREREAARRRLGIDCSEPLVFSLRRLEPRMGLEELLRATAAVLDHRPVRLVIAGSGILDEPLRRIAAEIGISERVGFLGRIPDEQLPDWYSAADIVVMPTVAYEGFGLVTAEALACGTPVVGTRVGATPGLLEPLEPRLIAGGTDPSALAEAIERALDLAGPELRSRCRDYALRRLSWDSTIGDWERSLEEAAGRPGASTSAATMAAPLRA
jgi:glycosyltransferase involved in cell wall biosynthesis